MMTAAIFGPSLPNVRRLDRGAFNRPTLQVARGLVGAFIVRRFQGRRVAAMITEVEAYKGPQDRASHAYAGARTPRTEALYGDGGTAYTTGVGKPEGVLIRSIVAGPGGQPQWIVGPGKVSQYLKIDKRFNGTDVIDSKQLWLEDRGVRIPPRRLKKGPRIGVDYAGPYWAARPWRFWIDMTAGPLTLHAPKGR